MHTLYTGCPEMNRTGFNSVDIYTGCPEMNWTGFNSYNSILISLLQGCTLQ